LLKEALDRGHIVTAIVRHPKKLEKREGLTAKAGDVYDTTSFATLIQGNDAIISAFNPGWKNPNLYDDQVRERRPSLPRLRRRESKGALGRWGGRVGGQTWSPRRR
jgi:putative NADH-flavin reductase